MKIIITIVRIAIGWHFLYEGFVKLLAGNWSCESFLLNSQGPLSPFYQWLVAAPERLATIDFLNEMGLTLIGLSLCLGILSRWVSLLGALLLSLYYLAYPPFGASLLTNESGVYIVNQLFIEIVVLILLFLSKEQGYGMAYINSYIVERIKDKKSKVAIPHEEEIKQRRELIKNLAILPILSITGWKAFKDSTISGPDALSGATIQVNQLALNELKGYLPKGKIGSHQISRMILGGNLFDGTAHARDLLYVSSLFKAYNSEKKIFETLMLAEEAGINCIAVSDWVVQSKILNRYKKLTGSKLKVHNYYIFEKDRKKNEDGIKKAIDLGVDILQVHGTIGDRMVLNNRVDVIGDLLEIIRSNGVVAGLGAHDIHAFLACEKQGIIPDFYMKTMHNDHYWSAHPRENRRIFEMSLPDRLKSDHNMWHDNLFDTFPDMTVEFINRATVPVIGFKVLAGGAIEPKEGFKYAFENGADFICVGMFDFQIVNDVNICIDTIQNLKNRKRLWYS